MLSSCYSLIIHIHRSLLNEKKDHKRKGFGAIASIPNLSTPNMSKIPNFFSTGLKLLKGDNSVKQVLSVYIGTCLYYLHIHISVCRESPSPSLPSPYS